MLSKIQYFINNNDMLQHTDKLIYTSRVVVGGCFLLETFFCLSMYNTQMDWVKMIYSFTHPTYKLFDKTSTINKKALNYHHLWKTCYNIQAQNEINILLVLYHVCSDLNLSFTTCIENETHSPHCIRVFPRLASPLLFSGCSNCSANLQQKFPSTD